MNVLAHLVLSENIEPIIVGNFIADAVKGKNHLKYPEEIQKGILFHREIDQFTDSHPLLRAPKSKLHLEFRHFSGVILDIYLDHFLSVHWHKFYEISLIDFSSQMMEVLDKNREWMPAEPQQFLEYVKRYRILENYHNTDVLQKVFEGMSRRTIAGSKLELATNELLLNYEFYEGFFWEYWQDCLIKLKVA